MVRCLMSSPLAIMLSAYHDQAPHQSGKDVTEMSTGNKKNKGRDKIQKQNFLWWKNEATWDCTSKEIDESDAWLGPGLDSYAKDSYSYFEFWFHGSICNPTFP